MVEWCPYMDTAATTLTVLQQAQRAKEASRVLAGVTAEAKTKALMAMAVALEMAAGTIVKENQADVAAARASGLNEALVNRLELSTQGVQAMAKGVREIAQQKDPIGEILETQTRPNGIRIDKVRVPLGVIGMVYESRPNVTVDAAALALRAGNAVILRGGSEAFRSNQILALTLSRALKQAGLPEAAVQLVQNTSRTSIQELIRLNGLVDLVIARGSEEMINAVMKDATVPVLGHGKGVCHVYVDDKANMDMAQKIAFNAKVQRPGVCNAMETLLVHKNLAARFLPVIGEAYQKAGVEIRGDATTQKFIPAAKAATEADWATEYLDLIVSVRVVDSLDAAVDHIHKYGSGHSDSIVTEDAAHAEQFLKSVDSAAVFHNASTRLHDGSVFGLGAEIGISTRKFHARGTMGARELTTTKYVVHGTGQIRE